MKEEKVKKATNAKVRALIEHRRPPPGRRGSG